MLFILLKPINKRKNFVKQIPIAAFHFIEWFITRYFCTRLVKGVAYLMCTSKHNFTFTSEIDNDRNINENFYRLNNGIKKTTICQNARARSKNR